MTDIQSTTAGYFPRPDYIIETLKDVEGYQKHDLDAEAEKEVEDEFTKGREEVLTIQEDAGIDLPAEGQLSWDDILAFPATRIEGIEMGGIVRFYDNNRFYRQPQIQDSIDFDGEITLEQYRSAEELADGTVKPVMAGPYSLARLSKNHQYDSEKDVVEAFAEVVNRELRNLVDEGAETIQLDEPSLTGVNEEGVNVDAAVTGIDRALEDVDADVIIQTYFGDIADAYGSLLEVADGVGLDLVEGKEENLKAVEEYGAPEVLSAGVMNSRNTRMETAEGIEEEVEEVLDAGQPSTLHVGPNAGLDFLPWTVMKEKVEVLGTAIQEVK
ncbi:MAG: hypothetical protein ABEK59_12905 [Halobacteria archaeon]